MLCTMTEIGKSARKEEQLSKVGEDIGRREPEKGLVLCCSHCASRRGSPAQINGTRGLLRLEKLSLRVAVINTALA